MVPGQRLGDFSKANWGDKIEFREGRGVPEEAERRRGCIQGERAKSSQRWEGDDAVAKGSRTLELELRQSQLRERGDGIY